MVTKTQWQAAQRIIAEATYQQGTNNVGNVLAALESVVCFRHLVVYQWDIGQTSNESAARFSIELDRQQRFQVSSIDHPGMRHIRKEMEKHQATDLVEEAGKQDPVNTYQVSERPQHLVAMCRERLPGLWSASMMLLLHCPDSPVAPDHFELLQCMLPAITTLFRKHIATNTKASLKPLTTGLTPREKQVLHLLISGVSSHQMSRSLGIAKRTLQFHLKNIYRKMDAKNRQEAIIRAHELEGMESAGTSRQ